MEDTRKEYHHRILSFLIIVCGLLYIFAYQFKLPFKADVFLYGIVLGLVVMALHQGRILLSRQVFLFFLVAFVSFIGILYTTRKEDGTREAILFFLYAGMFMLSLLNRELVKSFAKWIYLISIIVVLSSILHYIAPTWFNLNIFRILREDAFARLIWSYQVDSTYAGIAAYTSNATFSSAIVFGNALLALIDQNHDSVFKKKLPNILLLTLSLFSIIICGKRGMFIASLGAVIVVMAYLYRGRNFFSKFIVILLFSVIIFLMLYFLNDNVAAFFDRFVAGDFLTGRGEIYEALMANLQGGRLLFGWGTGATYELAEYGAHNIYLQILYDHGVFLSIPYYALLIYNYYLSFKGKCLISIFVQTVFLVYGISGNPLYSNMFMIIYIYHVLYAIKLPETGSRKNTTADKGNGRRYLAER